MISADRGPELERSVSKLVEAEADLEAIVDCTARDKPVRALSFICELHRPRLDIADMPRAWTLVPRQEHHGVRRRVDGRYLIFHRMADDRITWRHVVNGARGVERLLFPECRAGATSKLARVFTCPSTAPPAAGVFGSQ